MMGAVFFLKLYVCIGMLNSVSSSLFGISHP